MSFAAPEPIHHNNDSLMTNHRFILICSLLICAVLPMAAQDGSTAYNYLNITSSARIYGLGGVNISTVEDLSLIHI